MPPGNGISTWPILRSAIVPPALTGSSMAMGVARARPPPRVAVSTSVPKFSGVAANELSAGRGSGGASPTTVTSNRIAGSSK